MRSYTEQEIQAWKIVPLVAERAAQMNVLTSLIDVFTDAGVSVAFHAYPDGDRSLCRCYLDLRNYDVTDALEENAAWVAALEYVEAIDYDPFEALQRAFEYFVNSLQVHAYCDWWPGPIDPIVNQVHAPKHGLSPDFSYIAVHESPSVIMESIVEE